MAEYELSDAAAADLRDIALYTDRTWGREQAERYRAHLEAHFESIAHGDAHSRPFHTSSSSLRVSHCRRHYVFFLTEDGAPPLIVAVFHDRMDLLNRLRGRLGKDED